MKRGSCGDVQSHFAETASALPKVTVHRFSGGECYGEEDPSRLIFCLAPVTDKLNMPKEIITRVFKRMEHSDHEKDANLTITSRDEW